MAIASLLKRFKDLPGVLKARHLAEVSVTPHVRGHLAEVSVQTNHVRDVAEHLAERVAGVDARLDALQHAQPLVLNAITSTNGVARRAQRELAEQQRRIEAFQECNEEQLRESSESIAELHRRVDALSEQLPRVDRLEQWVTEREGESDRLIELWRSDLAPHVETLHFLLHRIEMIRAETMNEIRYASAGSAVSAEAFEARVVRPEALQSDDLRLNLGCGHVALQGYANIDMRELPGVDVVARLDDLPVSAGSAHEIFSSHVLEHFPREELVRHLLPYWVGLLAPGGVFRAVVPDIDAMTRAYAAGTFDFVQLREVLYGGQEYEGDTHFNGFTPDDLRRLLADAGLVDIEVVDQARVNGACLETEVRGVRPAS